MNVVLITVDCLRQDRCGVYGHHRDTTPTLDELAQDSYIFDNAVATGPGTSESFPGILAGRLSSQCVAGEAMYQKRIPDGEPTLASHLRDEGWSTTAVISNPRIGSHVATDRGFEHFENLRGEESTETEASESSRFPLPELQIGERLYRIRERMRKRDSIPYRYEFPFLAFRYYQYFSGWPSVAGEVVIDEFLDALEDFSEPFFGWTHLMDVHGPIHPRTVSEDESYDASLLSQFRSHAKRVSDTFDPAVEPRYDSAVRYVDGQIQRVIDWLKRNQLWDDTVLIVTADHGDALYDRGIYGHRAHYMYEELLAVPLFVRVPGREGGRIDRPFSLGWLHELVTQVCDIPVMDAPLVSSGGELLSEASDEDEIVLANTVRSRGQSIVARRGDAKLVRQTGKLNSASNAEIGTPGIYKLDTDPAERTPLDDTIQILEDTADEMELDKPEAIRPHDTMGIDQDTRDQLKQLGYAE